MLNKSGITGHQPYKKTECSHHSGTILKHPDYRPGLLAYVTNMSGGTVSVIDILRSKKIKEIKVGSNPYGIDISPDKRYVYVANFIDSTLSVIRTSDNCVVDTIELNVGPFTAADSAGVKVSPDGRYVYVVNILRQNISVVDAVKRQVITTVNLSAIARFLDITRDGLFAYVGLSGIKQAAVVDLSTNKLLKTVPVGDTPIGVTTSPTEPLVLVANSNSGDVTTINTEIAEASLNNIPSDKGAYLAAFDPCGKIAYVTNSLAHNISVIDVFTRSKLLTIPLDESDVPFGIKVTPNGRFIVAACGPSNAVVVIDAKTNQIVSRIQSGNTAFQVAILDTCIS